MRTRDTYKFVDEFFYTFEEGSRIKKSLAAEAHIAKEIISFQSDNAHISEKDVIVEIQKINYAFKDKNPVDLIHFYSKFESDGTHITLP